MIKDYNGLKQYVKENHTKEYEDEYGQVRYEGLKLTDNYELMYDHHHDCVTLEYMIGKTYMHSTMIDEDLLNAIITLGKVFN